MANYVKIEGADHGFVASNGDSDYVDLLLSELTADVPSEMNTISFTPGEKDASTALVSASA